MNLDEQGHNVILKGLRVETIKHLLTCLFVWIYELITQLHCRGNSAIVICLCLITTI
jgi:hypothetical protein